MCWSNIRHGDEKGRPPPRHALRLAVQVGLLDIGLIYNYVYNGSLGDNPTTDLVMRAAGGG